MPAMSLNPANLIYGGATTHTTDDSTPDYPDVPMQVSTDSCLKPISTYVKLFEEMISTVLEHESALFSHDEIGCFKYYDQLTSEAKFLLVRLNLRKADKWFRFNDISKYRQELGDDIAKTMDELCANAKLKAKLKAEKDRQLARKLEEDAREYIIVLDDEEAAPPSATTTTTTKVKVKPELKVEIDGFKVKVELQESKSNVKSEIKVESPQAGPSTSMFDTYESTILAESEEFADIRELLECLNVRELQTLAKSMKVKITRGVSKQNLKHDELVDALVASASSQSTIQFSVAKKGKIKDRKASKQTQLSFVQNSQLKRLRELVIKTLEKCIKINPDIMTLFQRVQLVYYRYTTYSDSFMTPAILARFQKRTYAEYDYKRTRDIWPSRDALLEYERALIKEFEIDEILAGKGASTIQRGRSMASKTPAPLYERIGTTPPPTPSSAAYDAVSSQAGGSLSHKRPKGKGVPEEETPRQRDAQLVKKLFESVYDEWKALVLVKPEQESVRTNGLERFDCGHVLTRIVCKGADALGVLKQHGYELQVLDALLSQTRWRKPKRGCWHDRRALILMKSKDPETLRIAKLYVEDALEDSHTHTIWRPKLHRRLVALEKKLKTENRHVMTGKRLKDAVKEYLSGDRLTMVLDNMGRQATPSTMMAPPPTQALTQWLHSTHYIIKQGAPEVKSEKAKGKSVWKGRNSEQVSVEILALQYYESKGYKGFHCEGRALRTIFGLLFWDIIFASVPGAFETPFQTAPLDISHETFYTSRLDLIERRLQDIREGKAREILEATDTKYRENAAWCVGVDWGTFGRQDLLEIVDCLGGAPLSDVCEIIAQDYKSRSSGLPDLVIWDVAKEENRCMFVEVKGPGDTLQENQKTWLDLLICAEIPVAVCHVFERWNDPRNSKRKRPAKQLANKRANDSDSEEDELESEEEDGSPRKRCALTQRQTDTPTPLPTGILPVV